MGFGFSKPRCTPIAVDFGADRLKLIQLMPGDPPQLVAAAAAVIPAEARSNPQARMAFLSSALKQLLKSQDFRGRRAICSIPAYQTLIQHIEVPRVEGADLSGQVSVHLMERLQVDPNKMVIRTTTVGQHQRNGSTTQEVACMAAPRDVVMSYIRLAEQVKLEVVGMHPEPTAILKAFETTYNRRASDKTQVACYIDIGAATTKVVIAHGFELKLAKAIQVGGDQATEAMAKAAGLSFDEARQARVNGQTDAFNLKATEEPTGESPTGRERRGHMIEHRETGIPALDAMDSFAGVAVQPEPEPAPAAAPAPAPTPARPGLHPAEAEMLDTLVDELRFCIRHYNALAPQHPIDRLVFLGGESNHTASCQQIARALHTAAQLGDPFARLVRIGKAKAAPGVNLDQPQPGWTVPFGLCHCEANL